MSAPDTNTEKQTERHKAPLYGGIMLPILFAGTLLVGLVVFIFFWGNDPEGAEQVIDGRTGEVTAPTLGN